LAEINDSSNALKKLYGLVVCGGQSTRMGIDKSLLNYHGLPQRIYLYHLMENLCDKVFISINTTQAKEIEPNYNTIIDSSQYINIGPMAALLSVYPTIQDTSFLVIACDYPFFNKNDLNTLIKNRDNDTDAICYFNPETKFEEPLLAIYENSCLPKLIQYYEEGNFSLRHFLQTINTKKIIPKSVETIKSIDSNEQYNRLIAELKKG